MSMDPMDLRERLKTGKTELQIDSNRVTIYDRYVSFVEETKEINPQLISREGEFCTLQVRSEPRGS